MLSIFYTLTTLNFFASISNIKSLLSVTEQFSNSVGLEFGLPKCAVTAIKKNKKIQLEPFIVIKDTLLHLKISHIPTLELNKKLIFAEKKTNCF